MNRLGVIVDVSHVSDEAFRRDGDLHRPRLRLPLLVPRLCNHPRNMTDEMIKACRQGGVIQINFAAAFWTKTIGACATSRRQGASRRPREAKAGSRRNEEGDEANLRFTPAPLPPLADSWTTSIMS